MTEEKTGLHKRIESGKPILIAEVSPPKGSDPGPLRAAAKRYAGRIHALGISDNRDGVCMSALVAASLVALEGVEPILHVVTRDRNRIALISDCLGALALGIRNVLCTSGTHQALGPARAARNVFDIDPILLLQIYAGLTADGSIVGEGGFNYAGRFCLGAVASPQAGPLELQVMQIAKKVAAGAEYLITQPIFDLERFDAWWEEITRRGIHEKVAIIAGIELLTDADGAKVYADKRPSPMIPAAVLKRITSNTDKEAQRVAGIEIALETIEQLSAVSGLRGFQIRGDGDAALTVIEKCGQEID